MTANLDTFAGWVPDEVGGWECDLGGLVLSIDMDFGSICWCVSWEGDSARGVAESVEAAKSEAIKVARAVWNETHERIAHMVNLATFPPEGRA